MKLLNSTLLYLWDESLQVWFLKLL